MGQRFFEFLSHDERVDCLCLGDLAKYPPGTMLVSQPELVILDDLVDPKLYGS